MLNSFRPKSNCEEEAKFLQDRIQVAENNLADLCNVFGQYARKVARLRDKGDELANTVLNISKSEDIHKSLAAGLESFASSISLLGDYGDARTQRLELKVVEGVSCYEDVCKKVRDDLKDISAAKDKEIQRKRQLDKIRERNPRNRQQIIQAETDLVKATAELSKTVHTIEEKATTFERQKLHDVKAILLDFISTELGYHARALEVLTEAYSFVNNIDEESDLEEFKKSLRLSDTINRHSAGSKNVLLRSAQSLGSLKSIFSTSHSKRNSAIQLKPQIKKEVKSGATKQNVSESEDNLSDDDDDDESEDSSEESSKHSGYETDESDLNKKPKSTKESIKAFEFDKEFESDKDSPIVVRKKVQKKH